MDELLASRFPPVLPTTGAWTPADPPGDRSFLNIINGKHPFALEGGGRLKEIRVAYETWGTLNEDAGNAVLVCHAFTGDSHATGAITSTYPGGGWWNNVVGPGKAIDTSRYFVVCSNVLGGCQGTTGPADTPPEPETMLSTPDSSRQADAGYKAYPYGSRFPVVTIRDMVRVQALLADHLGIRCWLSVAGGSMGGMQALEWAVMYPKRVRSILPLATCTASSPTQIAWNAVGRLAVAGDPHWQNGDYYDKPSGPWWGLAVARELAQVTYRSSAMFDRRFGRDSFDLDNFYNLWGRFEIESYLDHHGQKLVRRFDANTYMTISKAIDLHDIGRNRGGIAAALHRIKAPVLTAAISSDILYPPCQQEEIYDGIVNGGGDCRFLMIDSDEGHDAFLLETEQMYKPISAFLDEIHETV